MFLHSFALQIVQPLSKGGVLVVVPLPSAFWRPAGCLYSTCVQTCECTQVCACVFGGLPVFICSSSRKPYLSILSFPLSHCISLNAPVACLPTRTYADLLYKTFQLKIAGPSVNLAPFVHVLLFGSDPSWKDEEWFLCLFRRGGLWVISTGHICNTFL